MAAGIPETIAAAFRRQARACRDLGSPFTARLCDLFTARRISAPALARAVYDWPGDPTPAGDNVPLRVAGALHALVLEGRSPALQAVYPPRHEGVDDVRFWTTVDSVLAAHEDMVLDRLRLAPQTNEVRRSGALLPGFLTIARRFGKPLVISEIGASAGLNLFWDRFTYRLGDRHWGAPSSPVQIRPAWSGAPEPVADIAVLDRAGCDLAPLDPADPADCIRLLSYIWADQDERLQRTRAALALAAAHPERVAGAAAGDWLEERLRRPHPEAVHVVCHSIVWQYLGEQERERCRAALAAAGRLAGPDAPLAWLRMEVDGQKPGAALTLTLWPGGAEHTLGRADFHGRWVDWRGLPEEV